MDFSFTDEQQQLRRTVREFAEGEIRPHVMEWDEASHFPEELVPKPGNATWPGEGGSALTSVTSCSWRKRVTKRR
ncbi:MAG: acyl-CoA dehydrogenase family protein, partial [Acidobacteria bacterium]|nr:acyl-CoA dehydrogenase family protein [Acidobacteriota bacterium]